MKTLIILLSIYIISALSMYFLIRKEHSKGGDLEGEELKFCHLVATFVPLVNTVILLLLLIIDFFSFLSKCTTTENLSKFYKLKR